MAKIVVPELGESIVEARVARWLKQPGDRVAAGEPVVELETDKIDLEVGAEKGGVLTQIARDAGADVKIGEVLGVVEESGAEGSVESGDGSATPAADAPAPATSPQASSEPAGSGEGGDPAAAMPSPDASPKAVAAAPADAPAPPAAVQRPQLSEAPSSPAPAFRTGPAPAGPAVPRAAITARPTAAEPPSAPASGTQPFSSSGRPEVRERMSKRRQTIARRLVEAQRTAAMLTTFNEVDMSALMALRERHKEAFKARHGVGLGIASIFVKAAVAALREFPRLNAEIQDDVIVLKQYYDIGIAVGAEGGLVVPVLRDADRMGFGAIETGIRDFAKRAADGALTLADLAGGTFTITNGGVFGSLMSTPILNPPQVGILGLHKIQDRAVPVNGQVAIRPMMYVALSYDHRLVDGREAVQFLVKIKEYVEDPGHLLLEA